MATGSVRPSDYTVGDFPAGAGFTAITGTSSSALATADRDGTPTFRFDFGVGSSITLRGFTFDPVGTADDVEFFLTFRLSSTIQDSWFPVILRGSYTDASDFDMYIGPTTVVGTGDSVSDWRKATRKYLAGSNSGYVTGPVQGNTTKVWDFGIVYYVRMQVEWDGTENTVRHKMWQPSEDEPIGWDATGSDADLSPGGFHGFGLTKQGSTFDLDYVGWGTDGDSAPSPSETSTSTDVPSGFRLSATSGARQLAGSWDTVAGASGYDWEVEWDNAGTWTALTSGNTSGTSFQLDQADGVGWSTTYRARVRTAS